jgi:transposase
MWTPENRKRYERSHLRYPGDLTDEEWALAKPHIASAVRGGRKREVNGREVLNGIVYVLSTGCRWRALPKDLPPKSTVWHYLDLWSYDGTLERIHYALYVKCREQAEREASPTAAVIGSLCAQVARRAVARRLRCVKSAEKGGPRSIRLARMQERRSRVRSGIFL